MWASFFELSKYLSVVQRTLASYPNQVVLDDHIGAVLPKTFFVVGDGG
jgi:hypothetical protein